MIRRHATSRVVSAALILFTSSVIAACTFTIDLEPLENEDCGSDQKACPDPMDGNKMKCVSRDSPRFGCGSTGCVPCVALNAVPVCDSRSACDYATCNPGFSNCDNDRGNGCEQDIAFDEDNCNGCGVACVSSVMNNADGVENTETVACVNQVCRPDKCLAGWGNCDGMFNNGCEAEFATDNDNCGACDNECNTAAGETCVDGLCVPS